MQTGLVSTRLWQSEWIPPELHTCTQAQLKAVGFTTFLNWLQCYETLFPPPTPLFSVSNSPACHRHWYIRYIIYTYRIVRRGRERSGGGGGGGGSKNGRGRVSRWGDQRQNGEHAPLTCLAGDKSGGCPYVRTGHESVLLFLAVLCKHTTMSTSPSACERASECDLRGRAERVCVGGAGGGGGLSADNKCPSPEVSSTRVGTTNHG